MERRVKRKLSAILSSDVKGYSRLMENDELATVRTLEAYRKVIAELVKKYCGRVVDSPGDNLLAEFSSVVDAVECAVEVQKELKVKNEDLPENRRMVFRIGINLGDVIEEGDRIYGDGVNIAARMENLAAGGSICVSGTVFDHVDGKLELEFDYVGEKLVKNIKKPLRVYRAKMAGRVSELGMDRKLTLPDIRLNPYYPAHYTYTLGKNYLFLKRFDEAIEIFVQLNERCQKGELPVWYVYRCFAELYWDVGKEEEARKYLAKLVKANPCWSLQNLKMDPFPYKNPAIIQQPSKSLKIWERQKAELR
jgi:class 3 adenylate cyclase